MTGYFKNASNTLRDGIEAKVSYRWDHWNAYANYTYVNAVYRSALLMSSPNDPFADANGNIFVAPSRSNFWSSARPARRPTSSACATAAGPGQRADVNLIDFDRLRLYQPELVNDLPAGGRRLVQRVDDYEATFVAGTAIFEQGEHTGALPGRLVRAGRG